MKFSLTLILFCIPLLYAYECSDSVYQTYDDLVTCLRSVPFNQQVKDDTLTTLRKIIPSYVFVDSVKDSADPTHIPISVNLESGLDTIEKSSYSNDEELQQAFASLITQLDDAHTRYTKPKDPYCVSSFVLPFTFYSRVSGNPKTQKIFLSIRQELLDEYEKIYSPLSSNSVDGYQVLLIDNEDPVMAIGNFANSSVGYTKDYSARFNLAIDGYGRDFPPMYTWRNQSLQGIPSQQVLGLTLQSPEGTQQILEVNWMGVYDKNSPIFNITEEQIGKVGVHQLEYFEKTLSLDLHKDLEEPEGDPDVYYSIINNGYTGVLRIYTFSPKSYPEFVDTIQEAVMEFKKQNVEQLIIDVSQNGGGSICLGYAVERFLFPDLLPYTGAYEIKGSDLFLAFTNAASSSYQNRTHQVCGTNPRLVGYFTPCAWFDWYSDTQYYDSTWMIPGYNVSRGGVNARYSTFFTQNCQTEYSQWIPGESVGLNLSPENIILVSDGLCGSTCSVFARHLQLRHRVKTVTTGGVYGTQQPSFTSFPGGEVVHLSYMFDLASRYNLTDSDLVPPPLPTTADFRFAIRAIFGWDDITSSSVPQEFTYIPGDWQIFYDAPFENRTAIWNQLLPFFDNCTTNIPSPCRITHGYGTRQCSNGILSDTCEPLGCDPGYEFYELNGTCTACGVGYYQSRFGSDSCLVCPAVLPSNCYFTETAVTSYSCPFACKDCVTCPTSENSVDNAPNQFCLDTWAFSLLLVALVLVSCTISGLLASFATKRYYSNAFAFESIHENDGFIEYD